MARSQRDGVLKGGDYEMDDRGSGHSLKRHQVESQGQLCFGQGFGGDCGGVK